VATEPTEAAADARPNPYRTNLVFGVGVVAFLAVCLSLLSGDIRSFVFWFPFKLAMWLPIIVVVTWWFERKQPASAPDGERMDSSVDG
jgi:hypothetical protein